jgi:hypothetical protein
VSTTSRRRSWLPLLFTNLDYSSDLRRDNAVDCRRFSNSMLLTFSVNARIKTVDPCVMDAVWERVKLFGRIASHSLILSHFAFIDTITKTNTGNDIVFFA